MIRFRKQKYRNVIDSWEGLKPGNVVEWDKQLFMITNINEHTISLVNV